MDKKIKETILKNSKKDNGFIKRNNISIIDLDENYAKLEAIIDEKSLNPGGMVHGGLIFGLADHAMGVAAVSNGRNVCTVNSQIDYFRPVFKGKITAIAEAVKTGKTLSVYRCNLYDENEKLIACCTGTYYFID